MSQNKAFSTPFILAVLCIYFSYFLHGISVITLAQICHLWRKSFPLTTRALPI